MNEPDLFVIAGALARTVRPRIAQARDELAKRWRTSPPGAERQTLPEVIPLLDAWIRRLQRQAGDDPQESR